MDFKTMSVEELLERRSAIAKEIDAPEADLDALEAEARSINEELEQRKAAETKRNEIRTAVANGEGEVTKTFEKEERKTMTVNEIRNSVDYINAYANYIKTNDDSECRALLTGNADTTGLSNVSGPVPVPEIVENRVRAAWERNGLLDLVTKTYVKGNLSIGFEISATAAAIHAEGAAAPAEEQLVLGIVRLVPQSIKKWIRISDEALDLGGEEFLDYVYDEITYQIAKFAKAGMIGMIADAPTSSTATEVGVPQVTSAPDLGAVALALANLSDEASNVAVVMNRLTHAAFISAMSAANYAFDPFVGVSIHYDNTLPDYSTASAGDVWMIVGDFSGFQMNFPNGQDIRLKFDDLSEAEADLVKIVGRMYVGMGIVKPGAFVNVIKGA